MKNLLLTAALLLSGLAIGHANDDDTYVDFEPDLVFTAQNCLEAIGQKGSVFVHYTDFGHGAEFIDAEKVVRIDANTVKVEDTLFRLDKVCD